MISHGHVAIFGCGTSLPEDQRCARDHHRKYPSYPVIRLIIQHTCCQYTPDSTATTNTSKWRYVIILLVTGIVEARTSECHLMPHKQVFYMIPFPSVFPTLNKCCSLPRLNVIKQISPSFQSVSTTLPLWNRQCYFHLFSSFFLQLWNLFPTLFLFFLVSLSTRSTDHPMEAVFSHSMCETVKPWVWDWELCLF